MLTSDIDTVAGQTAKIVGRIENQLQKAGYTVRRHLAKNAIAPLSFEKIDKVILVTPVHERRHPKTFEDWITTKRAPLNLRQTLLISISLKAALPESIGEAQDYLVEMEMHTRFTPNFKVLAARAVRSSSYGYFESQVIQNVMLEGCEVDGVREFTDWDKLSGEVGAFIDAPLDMNQ